MRYENPMAQYVDEPFEFRLPKKKKKKSQRRRHYEDAYSDDYYVEHPAAYLPWIALGAIGLGIMGGMD